MTIKAGFDEPYVHQTERSISWLVSRWGMGGGSVASIYGWLSSNGAAVFIGVMVTILGFGVNYYFQIRRDRREREDARLRQEAAALQRELDIAHDRRLEELHQAQLAAIKNGAMLKV